MLSFQSSFEENEIWMFCKATCFKQKADHNKKRSKYFCFDFRSSHRRYSAKKGVLKKFHKFHRKTPVLESFYNKIADHFSPVTLLKRDSYTWFFLWNLRNFLDHLFWRTSANDRVLLCLKHGIRVFRNIFFFYFTELQSKFWSFHQDSNN